MKKYLFRFALIAIGVFFIALGVKYEEFDKQHYDTLAVNKYSLVTFFSVPIYESHNLRNPGYEMQYKEIYGKDAPPGRWRTGPSYVINTLFLRCLWSRRETYSGRFRDGLVRTIYAEYKAAPSCSKAKEAFAVLELELPAHTHLTSDDRLTENDMELLYAIEERAKRNILKIYHKSEPSKDCQPPESFPSSR